MRKASLWLIPLALLLLASCAGERRDPDSKTIGVTLLTRGHLFYRDLEEGLLEKAGEHGFELIVNSAEFDLGKQLGQMEDFVARRTSAIIVCPVDSNGVGPAIRLANRAGIPVFTADIAAMEGEVVSHIASDNLEGGRLAGEYLANALQGKGNIAIINQPVVTSTLDRVQGFRDAVARYHGLKIVSDVNGQGVRDKAMQAASDVLQARPELDGIFGINDDSALGAMDAVLQFQRTGIVIVGYDATPPALDAIRREMPLKADVVQHPRLMGTTTIDIIARYFAGEQVPPRVPIEVGIVDREALLRGEPR